MSLLLLLTLNLFTTQINFDLVKFAKQKQIEYNPHNKKYVVIIDYTKPMLTDRLFLINMETKEIILKTQVSHAIKTGKIYAKHFSNEIGSEKSCYGGFITSETYYGRYGYSLIVDGKDKGINDNARTRKIIFHSTKKMTNPKYPLTYGCFATTDDVNLKLINLIKGGCLVYVIHQI
jgi:3-phenylpropionate/cinnamic acid dioxygenase small subunit